MEVLLIYSIVRGLDDLFLKLLINIALCDDDHYPILTSNQIKPGEASLDEDNEEEGYSPTTKIKVKPAPKRIRNR